MNKKLYVGNLPYSITETELRDAFGAHGAIESVRIIMDKMSGRSKGFGFVEMASEDEAQKAVDGMNGKELAGRAITVSEARPEQPRAPRGGGFAGGGGGGYPEERRDTGRRNFRDRNSAGGGGGGGNGYGRGRGRGGGGGGGGGYGGGGGFDDDNFGNR